MIKKVSASALLFFLGILSAGPVLAVQPAQLIRSNELSEKQSQLMEQLRTSRAYVINDYDFSGIDLTSEQSAALAKLVEPVRGSFLNKDEVADLCQQIRDHIHKSAGPSGRVSCIISQQMLKIKYDK